MMKNLSISICIATYNRCSFLNDLLKVIEKNLNINTKFEIVITDGGSTDNTELVVSQFKKLGLDINYIKLKEKGGVDKDFDICVRNSKYQYCWLLPDDDLILNNSIQFINSKILEHNYPDVIILNSSCWNYDFSINLNHKNLNIESDIYLTSTNYQNDLFKLTSQYLSYIGAFVIKRDLWFNSNSHLYYQSRFIHVGVLSELPQHSKILISSNPIIKIRLGNAEWTDISFKVWFILWPEIINNFLYIDSTLKKKVSLKDFKSITSLFLYHRALGTFNFKTFQNLIYLKEKVYLHILGTFIVLTPSILIRIFYFIRYSFSNNKVGLFNIGAGRFSNNKWKSKI